MENIKEFLRIEYHGFGFGDGSCFDSCFGDGSGFGSGSGFGIGDGYGDVYGFGDSSGYGDGSGYIGAVNGSGIKVLNGNNVYQIDDIATIIKQVRNNVAKGFILNSDLSLTPCYIVKGHNRFTHGTTLKKAIEDLENKLFEDMSTDETIEMFLKEFSDLDKKYPAKAFYTWHNRLTGSCEVGRDSFVRNGGYDLENDTFTVQEFINITKDTFGGNIIKQLEKAIKSIQ
jgi:hypothetical protein